jgi:replicative DNA helicase
MVTDDSAQNVMPFADTANSDDYRQQPHNIEAEQALLGAILVNNRAFEKVSDFLEHGHFFDPVHARIYEACARLIERGQMANPVTLKNIFDQDEGLKQLDGAQYLIGLARSVVTVVNAEDYGQLIRDCYLRRELISIGETVVIDAYAHETESDAAVQIEIAESMLFNLAESGISEGGFQEFSTALAASIEMAEAAF